jgi:16S rRNA (guanine527-N7)-methyltransferase
MRPYAGGIAVNRARSLHRAILFIKQAGLGVVPGLPWFTGQAGSGHCSGRASEACGMRHAACGMRHAAWRLGNGGRHEAMSIEPSIGGDFFGDLSAETRFRLERFADLLLRWNKTLNLIAPRDEGVLWQRHIEDSLQLVPLMPADAARGVDLGSGGGFPGLVLSIATGVRFDLIEADRRKAAFLRSAVLETGAPAIVHACRIEVADISSAPVVTARALAPLARLLPLAARFLADDGVCLLLKGAKVDGELAHAQRGRHLSVRRVASRTSPEGVILVVKMTREGPDYVTEGMG